MDGGTVPRAVAFASFVPVVLVTIALVAARRRSSPFVAFAPW
jgi:hypothetical protein